MKKLLLGALLISNFAYAELVTLGTQAGEKSGVGIAADATINFNGQATPVSVVGSGVRRKNVLGVKDIYVAQLMVSDVTTYKKTEAEALATIAAEPVAAIRLTFVRDVPSTKVSESFLDAFDANGIDTTNADIKKFINIVSNSGGAANKGSLNIVLIKNADGTETLAYENVAGTKVTPGLATGAAGFGAKIFAIWLGVPADDYLAELKAELLQ